MVLVKFSRGGVDALTANEILGLEKKLTQRLSREYNSRRKRLTTSVLKEQKWTQVANDQSAWAFERARAAALFLEAAMDTGS
ncbi:hypothetical protein ACHAXA_010835 [Cyclostephanos tholiformis]|uniref:Uncharacterized protein n=1 Tax=Cyclostephanos tholiformis TaxID=382380 RepID=A0ABD3SGT9_9STRA